MLSFIKPDTLDREISRKKSPILIGFFRTGESRAGQIRALEKILELYGERLNICLGDEYFLDVFFEKFGFNGTPYFLLISDGREKNRFFGHADIKALKRFLRESGIMH